MPKAKVKTAVKTAEPDAASVEFRTARIVKKVYDLIGTTLGVDDNMITMDASLVLDLGADSLDVVELVILMEEAFDIEINDDKIDTFVYVKDLVGYLKRVVRS
jgi:acyl carrier protein